jgi:hypothetical protein
MMFPEALAMLEEAQEAHQHDPDDPDYWLGGFPRKWWDRPGFAEWVAACDAGDDPTVRDDASASVLNS